MTVMPPHGRRSRDESVPSPRIPDRVGVVGDVHGSPYLVRRAIETFAGAGIAQLHFLGDFGFPSADPVADEEYRALFDRVLARHPGFEVLVTLGNHEAHDVVEAIEPDAEGIRWWADAIGLLPRGWRGRSAGGRVLASLGGANSIDRFVRAARGWPWAPEESITEDDLERLGTDPVDVLLGHDAPFAKALARELAARADEAIGLFGQPLWDDRELAYALAGQRMFHRGVEQVRPRMTLGGHYHFFIDAIEQYEDADSRPFDCRTIVLNADGKPRSGGIVVLDELLFEDVMIR